MTGHDWHEYDPFHRACLRCGLRVFMRHQGGRVRGWQSLDWRGMPGPLILSAKNEAGGNCEPPPAPPIAEPVIIEYTGDPDQHPGCERVMHAAGGLGSAAGLVAVTELAPACGVSPTWWELGPARVWHGWNWCATCFPTRTPHHVPPSELRARQAREVAEREAKREAKALRAAEKRKAAKAAANVLRFPIPPRSCPECLLCVDDLEGGARSFDARVVRVSDDEGPTLGGLVLLLCADCAAEVSDDPGEKPPRKG